jgi:hypothetical protein
MQSAYRSSPECPLPHRSSWFDDFDDLLRNPHPVESHCEKPVMTALWRRVPRTSVRQERHVEVVVAAEVDGPGDRSGPETGPYVVESDVEGAASAGPAVEG